MAIWRRWCRFALAASALAVLGPSPWGARAHAATHVYPPGDTLPGEILDRLAPGDTLLVSPGARKAALVLGPGITVRGDGSRDAVIFTINQPGVPLIYIRGGTDTSRVENITFDCAGDQITEALHFQGGNLAVRGNRFVGGIPIAADSTKGIVTENVLDHPKTGMFFTVSEVWIDRNEIVGARDGAIKARGSPLRITRNQIIQSVNTGIVVSGKRFAPVIGGEPGMGNEIYGGFNSDVYTAGGQDINAQYNYWGLSTTEEMNRLGYPANIAALLDGLDQGKDAGRVDYRNWLDRPGGEPVRPAGAASTRAWGVRIAAGLVALLVLIAVVVAAGRRRASVASSGGASP